MELAARIYPTRRDAQLELGEGELVHILQFLFEVDTCVDKHKPIPVAIVKNKDGLLRSVRIDCLKVG